MLDLRELPMWSWRNWPRRRRSLGAHRLPYRNWYYGNLWRKVRKLTVISKEVWNRNARAGGVTEGRLSAVPTDDLGKTAGHNNRRTTGGL
jgi:hypothetical protein